MNPKQRKFCEIYAQCLNATAAAKKAGYSPKTAEQQASRLLRNVKVKAEIAKLIGKATSRAEVSLEWVLTELKSIASVNMYNFCSWTKKGVKLTPSADLAPELLAAVESVGETQDKAGRVLVKIRLHSKLQAINAILRLYEISETEARLTELEEKLRELQAAN